MVIVNRVNRVFSRRRGRATAATKRHSDTLMSSCLWSRGDAIRVTRMEARPSQTLMVRGSPRHSFFLFFCSLPENEKCGHFPAAPEVKPKTKNAATGGHFLAPFCGTTKSVFFFLRTRAAVIQFVLGGSGPNAVNDNPERRRVVIINVRTYV